MCILNSRIGNNKLKFKNYLFRTYQQIKKTSWLASSMQWITYLITELAFPVHLEVLAQLRAELVHVWSGWNELVVQAQIEIAQSAGDQRYGSFHILGLVLATALGFFTILSEKRRGINFEFLIWLRASLDCALSRHGAFAVSRLGLVRGCSRPKRRAILTADLLVILDALRGGRDRERAASRAVILRAYVIGALEQVVSHVMPINHNLAHFAIAVLTCSLVCLVFRNTIPSFVGLAEVELVEARSVFVGSLEVGRLVAGAIVFLVVFAGVLSVNLTWSHWQEIWYFLSLSFSATIFLFVAWPQFWAVHLDRVGARLLLARRVKFVRRCQNNDGGVLQLLLRRLLLASTLGSFFRHDLTEGLECVDFKQIISL